MEKFKNCCNRILFITIIFFLYIILQIVYNNNFKIFDELFNIDYKFFIDVIYLFFIFIFIFFISFFFEKTYKKLIFKIKNNDGY